MHAVKVLSHYIGWVFGLANGGISKSVTLNFSETARRCTLDGCCGMVSTFARRRRISHSACVRRFALGAGADMMDGMNRIDRMPQNDIQILCIL